MTEGRDTAERLAILETIVPRVETALEVQATTHFDLARVVSSIRDNMMTKDMLKDATTFHHDNKKRIDNLQFQVIALGGVFVLSLIVGAQKTLEILTSNLPKVLGP